MQTFSVAAFSWNSQRVLRRADCSLAMWSASAEWLCVETIVSLQKGFSDDDLSLEEKTKELRTDTFHLLPFWTLIQRSGIVRTDFTLEVLVIFVLCF